MKKLWEPLVGFVFLGLLVWVIYILLSKFLGLVGSLDKAIAAAILAASATVITSILTLTIGKYFERRREIESHFRARKTEFYDGILMGLFGVFSEPSRADDLLDQMREWNRKFILWSGPATIKAYIRWNRHLKSGVQDAESLLLMDDLFRAIRGDLGLSSRGLERGFSAHLILKNSELFMREVGRNPNITFAEVAKIEGESAEAGDVPRAGS